MSSSSSGGGEFVAGTPAKARPLLPAQPQKDGGRFARGPPLAQPAAVRVAPPSAPAACVLTDPAFQRVLVPAGRAAAAVGPAPAAQHAPLASRFTAPSVAEPALQWAGQGSSLLQRGAGGFSRIAQERQKVHGAATPAPAHWSEPSFTAAPAVDASEHAAFPAPSPRVEARCVVRRLVRARLTLPFAAPLLAPR